jgi:hypothetical protein
MLRPLNEQNLFPIGNHGDDSVEHELGGWVTASGLLEWLVASDTIAACRSRQQEIGNSVCSLTTPLTSTGINLRGGENVLRKS